MENNNNTMMRKLKKKLILFAIIGLLFTFALAILFFNLLSPIFTLFLLTFSIASYLLLVTSIEYIQENYIS